jgi:hypothetical protein
MKKIACSVLMSVVLIASMGASAANAGTYSGVWVNSDSFTSNCGASNYPSMLYSRASSIMSTLGFPGGQRVIGHGFTRAAFLYALAPEFAVYVHSHGDVYRSGGSAFWQDPPSGCGGSSDYVTASQVAGSAAPPYNLVIMSTCYLGSVTQPHSGLVNTMPEAFGIPKTHVSSGKKFYMGYVYETYDSAQYAFEGNLLSWEQQYGSNTVLSMAHWYASTFSYSYPNSGDPFLSAWYGDASANGNL